MNPDRVSRAITDAQVNGGYDPSDASWTHAAIYLGDGLHICEATFDWGGGSVRVTPIWDYCGQHSIRVRRSIAVSDKETGWLMAIYAMIHLRKEYDFKFVFQLAIQALGGKGFWDQTLKVPIRPTALVCSTLYADAHNRVTRKLLGERNGLCVPGFLSHTDEMKDIEMNWFALPSAQT